MSALPQVQPLDDTEIDRLDTFLMCPRTPDATMDIEMLDGFLVALTVGPEAVPEEEWLPAIFDNQPPEFSDQVEADDILGLIRRHAAVIADAYSARNRNRATEEPLYYPLVLQDEGLDEKWQETVGAYWAAGFQSGIGARLDAWAELMDADGEFVENVYKISALHQDASDAEGDDDTGIEPLTIGQREQRLAELPWLVEDIMYTWLEKKFGQVEQVVNTEPKVGRNDPCPCGSGKKFKKCHGA
ncbi:UPF0149 family protein YecA [Silvimonas sp. JCM 19000]